jgi:hypothetical protein
MLEYEQESKKRTRRRRERMGPIKQKLGSINKRSKIQHNVKEGWVQQ